MNHFSSTLNPTAFRPEQLHCGQRHNTGTPVPGANTDNNSGNTLPPAPATQPVSTVDKLGSSLSSLNDAIVQLRSQLEALTSTFALPASQDAGQSPSLESTPVRVVDAAAHFVSKKRGELTITTQDGDVVTLKFSNKVSADYRSTQASDGNTSVSVENLSVRSRTRIGISVAGDLDDKELAAINDLVGKVGQLTDDFYNGNVDQALGAAANLSFDTSELSQVSLSLSLRQRFHAYGVAVLPAAQAPAASPAAPAAPAESVPNTPVLPATPSAAAPVAVPAAVEPASNAVDAAPAPVSAEPASESPDTNAAATPATVPSSVPGDETAPASTPAPAPTANTQVLASFVAKIKANLQVSSTDAALGFSYDFKVRLLLSSLVINAPGAAPDTQSLNTLSDQAQTNAA